jgi:tetratricopeptide (TPR) repeat protein
MLSASRRRRVPAALQQKMVGGEMDRAANSLAMACFCATVMIATQAGAQSFGAAKEKVTLHRKLPALIHLPGSSIKVVVPGSGPAGDVSYDLQALLETEILKDDPSLRIEQNNPDTTLTCLITNFAHPAPTITTSAGVSLVKGAAPTPEETERITGSLSVAFQAKTASGRTLVSDNAAAKYDEEFDGSGISTSHGVMGSLSGTWGKLKGQKTEDNTAPTDAELRSRLLLEVVQQIAEHIVNTNEAIDVFLAKEKGAIEEGDKAAEGDQWERALETFETAPPNSKPEEDAYRLYDIGVAYEALAYEADDYKASMKYLDQAAINYGKAIDAKRSEKYFLDPQKRIETAIGHYKVLEEENKPAPPPVESASSPSVGPTATRGLSNNLIISMVKSGMDDGTIVQAVNSAKAVAFDLTPTGQQQLTGNGVSPRVLAAMKTQAATKSDVAPAPKGLTNNQVIAMIKSGVDDDTVVTAIRAAKVIDFDLTPTGAQQLTAGGVSRLVLTAMRTRAARKPAAAVPVKQAASQ